MSSPEEAESGDLLSSSTKSTEVSPSRTQSPSSPSDGEEMTPMVDGATSPDQMVGDDGEPIQMKQTLSLFNGIGIIVGIIIGK